MVVVMVMEVVTLDEQGRLIIPKRIRERKGLTGEVEILEAEEGVIIRPKKTKNWDNVLKEKLGVDWASALAVSLEGISMDDLLFR